MAPAPGELVRERYRVLDLEAGGCLRVEDVSEPGRALRLVSRPLPEDDRQAVQLRLADEIRRLSWLRHPHLGLPRALYAESDTVWTVMDETRGQVLERLPAPMPAWQALRRVSEFCAVYRHLHTAHGGLVLGRLSPGNVLLNPQGRLELIGFELDESWGLTFAMRDPQGWIAPECTDGEVALDSRSDVWCLGMLLSHLVSPAALKARARQEWQRVVSRATATDPEVRHGDVRAFKLDVDRVARLVEPPPEAGTARGPQVRPRVVLTGVSAVLLGCLLAAGLAWSGWQIRHTLRRYAGDWLAGPPASVLSRGDGDVAWIRGRVVLGDQSLRAPLSNLLCAGYTAHMDRLVQREVLDHQSGSYSTQVQRQTVLDRDAWRPFTVQGDGTAIWVMAADVDLVGPAETFADIPTTVRAPASVGQHLLAVQGTERRLVAGQAVAVRGTVTHARDGVWLRPPAHGPVVVLCGSWQSHVATLLGELVLPVLAALACLGLAAWGGVTLARRGRPGPVPPPPGRPSP